MDSVWLCPKCGIELKPSRRIPTQGWFECPSCARLVGVPLLDDPNDLGIVFEPWKDYSPDPGALKGVPPKRKRRGGGSKRKGRPKPTKRYRPMFPLPIPPPGSKMVKNGTSS